MHPTPAAPADGCNRSTSPFSASASRRRQRVDSNPIVPSAPEPKRIRAGDAPSPGPAPIAFTTRPAASAAMMSAKMQGKRPAAADVVDLTRGDSPSAAATVSSFQPQIGARKLVIKNLRAAPPAEEVRRYYDRAWAELDDALAAIFVGRTPRQPLERLYRSVEDLCRNGQAERLYHMLKSKCEGHLYKEVLGRIRVEAKGGSDVEMLRVVYRYWTAWSAQSTVIRSTFSYLDRSFLLNSKTLQQINDMLIGRFRRMIFDSVNPSCGERPPGPQVLAGMCELVNQDRRADPSFDPVLLREAVTMLHVFNVYGKAFEPLFLQQSEVYLRDFAEERSASDLKDFILACQKLLREEDYRCNAYNFDSSTKKQLLDNAHEALIAAYADKLLDTVNVGKLLENNDIETMKALYELLRLSGIQKKLRGPWEAYIQRAGLAIVNDVDRGDEMIIRVLELRHTSEIMIRDAFGGDDDFTFGLREAFGRFINDRKTASSWKTGTSKVGEMIAKYMDMLLRGGLKTLPKALLSDSKDRAAAERSGHSSTGDEDAELDRQLDLAIELFRFIEGKDVFEAFYKKDLARRLLMGRSASQDAERNMLSKLKSECGSSFTHNLEQMFKDQELARDEMESFKQWQANRMRDREEEAANRENSVDLHVSVLSSAAWPTYPEVQVRLPRAVSERMANFEDFYTKKHTGRRLTWMHSLGHCVLKGSFPKGTKELLVSAFQATVLLLFNDEGVRDKEKEGGSFLSYAHIKSETGLEGADLERTLQSLACGKVRVLQKHPKGREVKPGDTFAVNRAFSDPKYRVKINQIQLKETREENQDTHERVAADRQFETQAAIVRIMKSRKTLPHAQLVGEVIKQTLSRGALDPADIKQNIEKLIEKDYLERDGSNYTYLA